MFVSLIAVRHFDINIIMAVVSVVLTTGTSWTIPANCPLGTVITVEGWGGGSGGSGRASSNYGASGSGGSYAKSNYTLTSADVATGSIAYVIGSGSAGTSGADPLAGGDTSFGNSIVNLFPNSTYVGAVLNPTNTLPTGWSATLAGLSLQVIAIGTDSSLGPALPYIDLRFFGTTTSTADIAINVDRYWRVPTSTAITHSAYNKRVAGSVAGLASTVLVMANYGNMETNNWTSNVNNWNGSTPFGLTTTLTRSSVSYTTAANEDFVEQVAIGLQTTGIGAVIDITIRIAGLQTEVGASATTFQPTPGPYVRATGAVCPNTTYGRDNFTWGMCVGTTTYLGGAGADYSASLSSGGGGAAGPDGAGVAGNQAGQGGAGDNSSGGAGGAVKSTSPGNAGTDNTVGGGGGGGLSSVSGTGGAGGAPGGGGGSVTTATGTGGSGAKGQIRLTYTSASTAVSVIWMD